ncbi:hypothetical protein A2W32_04085 [candidate division WWE3 bacterium RBG_16_37_10]|uniref:Uncharacterized protein n=1 Tax=candidate division WWE3 bacterium RBG_16_37_10 TaxID=1802610 RepID=A0A1F4UVT5_UNCKA|nr:MAG: hypothetical protein A2W32_04085 [candidate division WWE3 bacterium RBG_16_37_10]
MIVKDIDTGDTQSTPSSTPSTPVITPEPIQPAKPVCYTYTITAEPFISRKCYTQQDYADLSVTLGRYSNAKFSRDAADSTMDFVCDGSDFFKDSCDDAKDRKESAEDDMEKYEKEINEIISRGL